MERIAIVGAGLMGHGIAQVFAVAGCPVKVYDPEASRLATLRERIRANLTDLGLDPDAAARVQPCDALEGAVAGADIVFEAAPEKLTLKQSLFAALERCASRDAVLASNTSVIPIGAIAASVATRDRVVGTHWWNPPYLVPLVEVIETEGTAPTTVAAMIALLERVGKTPVHVRKDVPGFVGNRLQHALWREAIALVQEGVCDARTIDTVVKAGFGRRLAVQGPLETADLVGLDLTLDIHENVLPHLDRTPGPLPRLAALVEAGKLGMKTGEGFRTWTPDEIKELRARTLAHLKTMAQADRGARQSRGGMAKSNKIIITCAVAGGIHTPTMSGALPYRPEDIARQAVDAAEAGAAILHLHARDPETGRPTPDPAVFMQFLPVIKQSCDAVINVTTGGWLNMTVEQRLAAPLVARPEMCSLNMGSMNFGIFPLADRYKDWRFDWEETYLRGTDDFIFRNTFRDIERILKMLGEEHGARFEHECYDVGHLYNLAHFLDRGLIKPPFFVQLIFGILGGIGPDMRNLIFMKETADRLFGDDYQWSVLAAGRFQVSFATQAAMMGGNLRVGLEDSLYIGRGRLAESNADQVRKIRQIVELLGYEIATPAEARAALKLKGGDRVGF